MYIFVVFISVPAILQPRDNSMLLKAMTWLLLAIAIATLVVSVARVYPHLHFSRTCLNLSYCYDCVSFGLSTAHAEFLIISSVPLSGISACNS